MQIRRYVTAALGTIGLTVATTLAMATPAHAALAPSGCTYSKQIGTTGYLGGDSSNAIASVKQFFGYCNGKAANWVYVYTWDSFIRNNAAGAQMGWFYEGGIYRYDRDSFEGYSYSTTDLKEWTSKPAYTTTVCTSAYAEFSWDSPGGNNYRTFTSKAC